MKRGRERGDDGRRNKREGEKGREEVGWLKSGRDSERRGEGKRLKEEQGSERGGKRRGMDDIEHPGKDPPNVVRLYLKNLKGSLLILCNQLVALQTLPYVRQLPGHPSPTSLLLLPLLPPLPGLVGCQT